MRGLHTFHNPLRLLLAVVFFFYASALDLSEGDRRLICDASKHPFQSKEGKPAIRWLHFPKTGTSFANAVWHYGCPDLAENVSVAAFDTRFELSINDQYPIKEWCPNLVDHTPGTHKPIGTIEWGLHRGSFVSMFREPTSRIMSAFSYGNHHCIKDCNPENAQMLSAMDSVRECDNVRDTARRESRECIDLHAARCPVNYANCAAAQGCMTKMILGYPCSAAVNLTQDLIDEAVHRLETGFSFVGLMEEWDLSLCMFHRLLGGTFYPVESDSVRSGTIDHGPKDCGALDAARDPFDQPVYDAAKRVFERQVEHILKELKGEVSVMQHVNDVLKRLRRETSFLRLASKIHFPRRTIS